MDLSSFDCIEMAVFDTAALNGTYQPLNGSSSYLIYTGNGFEDSIKILKIYNESNVGITISYNGLKRQDYFPSGATIIIDLQTNHADNSSYSSGALQGRKGQIIYGIGSAGLGNLYISGYR